MIYTSKIQNAIDFAIREHSGQKRKGKDTPYIMHPFVVALILAKIGADENTIIAGILHDVIEDTKGDKDRVREYIKAHFGEEVYRMVNDVTEQDKRLPWEERKRAALEHLPQMNRNSLLVKSADVLHNMSDLVDDLKRNGDKLFERFNAPKEKQLERYTNLIKALEGAWSENPLLSDLQQNLKELLGY